jgi:hypothetical protein
LKRRAGPKSDDDDEGSDLEMMDVDEILEEEERKKPRTS